MIILIAYLSMEAPTVDYKENENIIQAFIEGESLYEIDFLKKNDKILIKCYDTSIGREISYSYKLTIGEIKKTTSCLSITNCFNKIQEFQNYLKIEKMKNFFLLHILLNRENKEFKTVKLEESSEEEELEGEIKNLDDAIKVIKILVKENKTLKNRLSKIENEFKKYKNKMELNFTYNSLDINSYKLDGIFKNLSCKDIIQNRDEFGLINTGFQHIYKSNIISFECIFKSINNEGNYQEFYNIYKGYKYLIIVIITKDKKRFGAFFKNYDNNNIFNNDEFDQINYKQFNNKKRGILNYNRFEERRLDKKKIFSNVTIFNSSSLMDDYFIFSLDELSIFYCNNREKRNNPQFSIFYDKNRQCLFGEEISNTYQFQLSGKKEFNIKDFELYNAKIGKL